MKLNKYVHNQLNCKYRKKLVKRNSMKFINFIIKIERKSDYYLTKVININQLFFK